MESEDNDLVAFDIETTSAIEKTTKVIGIGITYFTDEGVYFPFAAWNKETQTLEDLIDAEAEQSFVAELCKILLKKKLVMHNGVFDIVTMLHRYEIDLTPALHSDTILMKHTVDEERPFALKEIAEIYKTEIGFSGDEVAAQEQLELKESVIANGGKWTKEQKDIYKGDMEIIGKYCCADVDLTLKFHFYFQERLEEEDLVDFFYNQEVMPLYKFCTIPMKTQGVFVDLKYFKDLEKELESDIIKTSSEVFNLIEEDIKPLVEEILNKKIKETRTGKFAEGVLQYYNIPIPSNKKTGKPTLAKSALQSLQTAYPEHPALTWLLFQPKMIEVEKEVEVPEVVEVEDYEPIGEIDDKKIYRTIKKAETTGGTTTEVRKVLVPDPEDKGPSLPKKVRFEVKKLLFQKANPELPHIFNLASNEHLSWLIFEKYAQEPKGFSRKTGKPQVNKDALESYAHVPFVKALLHLKKQEKLLSTYVKPILDNNIDGWIFPSMLQFGTTSGRYSCAGGLNLQTLPRDDKRIKRGFIAPPGYKVVNADFSSLEPRIFSWVSGDPGLKRVWIEGLDLYSQIAIDVLGLTGVSARETDDNYLKKVDNDSRQKSKVFTLAVPYGANAWRIAPMLKVDPEEAKQIIDRYLDAYPELKTFMQRQEIQARSKGFVKTQFGRIRHLKQAKLLYSHHGNDVYNKKRLSNSLRDEERASQIYYEYRNQLNNAKNFPIQATAAHVCNAALIKLAAEFKKHKIDGWIALQVHDEITCIVKEKQSELAAKLLKDAMEHNEITDQIDIPITAEPLIADNFADAK